MSICMIRVENGIHSIYGLHRDTQKLFWIDKFQLMINIFKALLNIISIYLSIIKLKCIVEITVGYFL